jgi:branched-chain amino acid transport system substrate-binding protein
MKKRYLSLLSLTVLVGAIVVACGPTATPATTEEATTEATTEATPEETTAASTVPDECAAENACAVFAPGEAIKIGHGGPMSGDVSAFGIDASQGAALALKQHGEFHGHAYELVIEDDQGTADGGAAVANKLVSDPQVVAVVGHSFSGATNAAMPIYQTALVPMMSPSATRIDLTQQGNTAMNRVVPSDFFQGQKDAEFLFNDLGIKKLAITHDGTPYGQGLATRVKEVYEGLGGEVVYFDAITTGETDYSAVLSAILDKGPEAVFHGGYTGDAAVYANQRAGVGFGADIPFMAGDGIFGSQFIELAGDNSVGWYASNAKSPADSDLKTAFNESYKAEYGVEAGSLSGYTWFAADAASVLVQAIEAVAIVQDDDTVYIPRAALMDAVRHTSHYAGITGDVTCDENGECAGTGVAGFAVYEVKDGEWSELGGGS